MTIGPAQDQTHATHDQEAQTIPSSPSGDGLIDVIVQLGELPSNQNAITKHSWIGNPTEDDGQISCQYPIELHILELSCFYFS